MGDPADRMRSAAFRAPFSTTFRLEILEGGEMERRLGFRKKVVKEELRGRSSLRSDRMARVATLILVGLVLLDSIE